MRPLHRDPAGSCPVDFNTNHQQYY
jgi:hypothetical protein